MSALTPGARRVRTLARFLYWVAALVVATLALIALHYAVALVWPAYLIGGTALVSLYAYDRRARRARRPH